MRKLISSFIFILLLLLFVPGCKKCVTIQGEFSVLTYNVAGLPEGISSSHPELYMSSIGKLINGNGIVHVQEDFCYHDTLLQYDTHPVHTETTGCALVGSGLNTFSNYPMHNVYSEAWTDCTSFDCYTPKGFRYSQIDIAPGVTIDVYNAHTTAGSATASVAARNKNILQLCNYIKAHSAGRAVLIMGDLNSRYTRAGDTLTAITELGFQDVWIQLVRNNIVPPPASAVLDNCDGNRTNPDCESKDKVFYRSSDKIKLSAISYQVDDPRFYFNNNDSLPLSDHWPVFTKFSYKATE